MSYQTLYPQTSAQTSLRKEDYNGWFCVLRKGFVNIEKYISPHFFPNNTRG